MLGPLHSPDTFMRANTARGGVFILHGFYFLFYGLQGISIPFLPLWFAAKGLNSEQIGLIVAAAFLPKILSTPVFAHLADRSGQARTLTFGALIASLLLFLCYPLTDAPLGLLLLTLAINALFPAVQPLLDRMAISGAHRRGGSYTVIRAAGSLGFAAMTVLGGYLIKVFNVNWVLWLSMGLLVLCLFYVHRLPFKHAVIKAVPEPVDAPRFPVLAVLRARPVFLCIVAAALVQASNGFLYSYSSLYWTAHGLSTSQIAALWSVGIGSEVLFFLVARRIVMRTGTLPLIVLSAGMSALRWLGMALTADPLLMAGLQVLQCFTLAGNNAAIMWHINQEVAPACKTSAIALYAMLSGGVFMFVSVQAGGMAYRSYGPAGFLSMALCALLALPLLFKAARLGRAGAAA